MQSWLAWTIILAVIATVFYIVDFIRDKRIKHKEKNSAIDINIVKGEQKNDS